MSHPTAAAIEIAVNGEARAVQPGATVLALLRDHGLDPELVVVERNGTILPRTGYAATPLAPGDRLEIVHFVGGG